MPGRKYSQANSGYRYGFNGKENDNEIKGVGNQQDYGMRIYDSRLGRFLSVDPISGKYPMLTPYQFASNNPIAGIDLDGLEFYYSADGHLIGKIDGSSEIRVVNMVTVENLIKSHIDRQNKSNSDFKPNWIFNIFSTSITSASPEIQTRVFKSIYDGEIKGNSKIGVTSKTPYEGGHTRSDGTIEINKNNEINGEKLNDYYYNVVNTLFHEKQHANGVEGDGFAHFSIVMLQIKHQSWNNVTESYKSFLKKAAGDYLGDMVNELGDMSKLIDSYDDKTFKKYVKLYEKNVVEYNKNFNEKYDSSKVVELVKKTREETKKQQKTK